MGRKNGNLLELLVDKIVLAAAGIICLLVFFVFILEGPSSAEYDGRKFGPGNVDKYLSRKSEVLANKLKSDPNQNRVYRPQIPEYLSLLKSSIKDVDVSIVLPVAGNAGPAEVAENRVYHVPQLPDINSVSIAGVKMAAFVPTEKLDETISYEQAPTKLEDLYLVTVESQIDIAKIYSDFQKSFDGPDVKASWRDVRYARPVFARVELDRRAVYDDGSFGQWKIVPRTRIFNLAKTLKIPSKASPYEIEIAMHNFSSNPSIRNRILQPLVYDNAIPTEPWLSPSFYIMRKEILEKEASQQRRAQIEAARAARIRERASRMGNRRSRARTRSTITPGGGVGGGIGGGIGGGAPGFGGGIPGAGGGRAAGIRRGRGVGGAPIAAPRTLRRERPGRIAPRVLPSTRLRRREAPVSTPQIKISEAEKFAAVILTSRTDLSKLSTLYFWAHDETAIHGRSYQYRMRIGVFNPIAGQNWFAKDQQGLKNKVVLWSSYSAPSDVITIPKEIYFFPKDVREIKNASLIEKIIEVQVSRYTLGNWVSRTFSVRNGEQIGRIVSAVGSRLEDAGITVDNINFNTAAVMVDTQNTTEWTGIGLLRPRTYGEMIYGNPDTVQNGTAAAAQSGLEMIPIKKRNWPSKLVSVYNEIDKALKQPPVKLLNRQEAAGRKTTIKSAPSSYTAPAGGGLTPGGMMGMPPGSGGSMGMPPGAGGSMGMPGFRGQGVNPRQ